MGESDHGDGLTHAPKSGASAEPKVPCSGCGAPVDPLRAARVAFLRERFRYFCSNECREAFRTDATQTPLPQPRRRRAPGALRPEDVLVTRQDDTDLAARKLAAEALAEVASDPLVQLRKPPAAERSSLEDPNAVGELAEVASTVGLQRFEWAGGADMQMLLLGLSALSGLLAVALGLTGSSQAALNAQVVVLVVSLGALMGEYAIGRRDRTDLHPAALLAAPVLATLAAIVARVVGHRLTGQAITLAGLVSISASLAVWLVSRARRALDAEREQLAEALNGDAHRVVGDEMIPARANDLRPGEEVVVESGEIVPVDGTVVAGSATLLPWLGATSATPCTEGSPVVAGARVTEGRLRLVVGWASYDRAWFRLTLDPRRRADLMAPLARAGRLVAERVAPFAAGFAGLCAFAADLTTLGIVLVVAATQAALAHAGVAQIGALHVGRCVLAALRRGIAFRTAIALDRAGRASSVAFCARGTLLLGEPEVASIEPIGNYTAERVLSLVAGAEHGGTDPTANAVLRAARARNVRPDGVRSPNLQPGLGVTAVASTGEPLVVGTRALMLKERISVARAEPKINELEAIGRTTLLVALGGRLVGLVGLQDGLRPGARAAIQHLLDVGVEPVLLSGDTRETCETLGHALDIDHIRPELLPGEQGDEIRRMADGGATVAVVGHGATDEAALGAADVSVALGSAGTSTAEWSVHLASDDVRDAAYAIRLAHRCRREARLGLMLTIAPGVMASLAVAFNVGPPTIAPIASVLGTWAALMRFRALDQ
jgi:cation transport ATPase